MSLSGMKVLTDKIKTIRGLQEVLKEKKKAGGQAITK